MNALVFVVPNDAIDAFRLDHNIKNYWKQNCHVSEGCQHPNAQYVALPSIFLCDTEQSQFEQKDTP